MALVKCPECSREVSDAAKCCPHCGYPIADNLHHISDNGANDILQEDKIDNNNVDTSVGADTKQKTKLYQKTWFAFVMLFVFFPVGCFLIWKYKKANLPVRIISSVICGLPFLFWVFIFIVLLIPCEHEWKAATCKYPMTCEICGETSGNILDHKWEAATYTSPKTCLNCGETDGKPLERAQAHSSAGAISAIKECLEFIPNCNLSIVKETSSDGSKPYVIKNNGELVGIIGLNIDDFDVMALTDPDKANALLYHEQISIALLLSSDRDMTYEEAKSYFEDAKSGGVKWINGYASYISEGMASGMYAFGIGY